MTPSAQTWRQNVSQTILGTAPGAELANSLCLSWGSRSARVFKHQWAWASTFSECFGPPMVEQSIHLPVCDKATLTWSHGYWLCIIVIWKVLNNITEWISSASQHCQKTRSQPLGPSLLVLWICRFVSWWLMDKGRKEEPRSTLPLVSGARPDRATNVEICIIYIYIYMCACVFV